MKKHQKKCILPCSVRVTSSLTKPRTSKHMDETLNPISFDKFRGSFGWIFQAMKFLMLRSSHQALSNEGSNFIFSSPEATQSLSCSNMAIFDKLQIFASYNSLRQRQDSEFSKFSHMALQMLKNDQVLTYDMPRKIFLQRLKELL